MTAARCQFCDSVDGVQRYAVTVDGVALRLAPLLCAVLATLDRSFEQVFVEGGR